MVVQVTDPGRYKGYQGSLLKKGELCQDYSVVLDGVRQVAVFSGM